MFKRVLVMLAVLSLMCSYAYAVDEDDCKELFNLYNICYQKGGEIKSLDACKKIGDDMYNELIKQANSKIDEALTSAVSELCDDACRDAVDGVEKYGYDEFKTDECK
ncbi:MAG: hypothetical protein L3V56_00540 [Candidatus Magnetoovum sp. WYHC-5]|nr:hypothetical protein [Candidatus Magnetoovum sp. WYHC-5]